MKNMAIILLCFGLVGCVPIRTTIIKARPVNSISVINSGSVEESKQIIRTLCKEHRLIELKKDESPDFLYFRNNLLKASLINGAGGAFGLLGGLAVAGASESRTIGFLFDYDKDKNLTTIYIVENDDFRVPPLKFEMVERIKLLNTDKQKQLAKN